MQTNTQIQQDDLLTIDPSAYFEVEKKQLKYTVDRTEDQNGNVYFEDEYVNRYALVRKDNGKLLGIHSNDYIVRPYGELAAKVNDVILDAIPDIDKWKITTEDHIYGDGKKFRRNINFWNHKIYLDSHERANECIIPQVRIYSSLDGQWGQQIMFSSIYMWCLNGMVRPDWTFTVYNKHSSKQDITYSVAEFRSGLESHQEMGDEMFKMMQKKVSVNEVTELFRKTLANTNKRNLDIDNNSVIVMRDLDSLWGKYVAKYGNTVFAIYQTATDWATHPITRGAVYNVSRKREKQVAEMMQSKYWENLYG